MVAAHDRNAEDGQLIIQVAVAALLVTFIVGIGIGVQTLRYLRRRHPKTWREIGLPDVDPLFLPARHELAYNKAQPALIRFYWTAEYKRLRDPRLNALVRGQWLTFWIILILVLVICTALVID